MGYVVPAILAPRVKPGKPGEHGRPTSMARCLEGLREIRAIGAELLLLNPAFDEARHLELFAEKILPALQ